MYKAYVVELDNIRPHTNADRLNIARIFNTDVIIGKNLKVGDKVVYFPSDGQLDKDFAEYCNLLRKKDDLGNNIGGYMDPNKRNIKAIKLRGEYSDGIVIGIDKLAEFTKTSTDDYCSGYSFNEVNGYPICNKYVPKKKSNNQNNLVKKRSKNLSDKYPLFHEHYDTAQLAYNTNNILDGDKLTISLKMHGCFTHDARIKTTASKAKRISDIKVGDKVLGVDHNGHIVETKVLNTFINGKTKEWIKLKTTRNGEKGEKYSSVTVTPNHQYLCLDKKTYKPIKDFKVGDKVLSVKKTKALTSHQKSILIGKILGDGYLHLLDTTGEVQFSHAKKYEDYLDYTINSLGGIAYKLNHEYISGYGTTMVRARTFKETSIYNLAKEIVNLNRNVNNTDNRLKDNIVNYFNEISLAFLYMDDGNLAHSQSQKDRAIISICSYTTQHDVDILIKCFNKLGLYPVYYQDNNGYNRLRLNTNEAYKMFDMIEKYIPNNQRYKLPKEYRYNVENYQFDNISIDSYDYIENTIVEKQYFEAKKGYQKYDIETETHNYIAGGVIVHNSSQRTSYTKVFNKKSILDRIKSVFKPMESKYDLISGTRRVILDSFDGGFYGNNHFREQWHKFFDGKLEKGETVYYEVVGYTDKDSLIMPIASNKKIGDKEFIKKYGNETKFTYGCENGQSNIYVYRMSMTNEDGVEVDYSTDYTRIRCEQMGVNHVPILHEMIVDHHEVNHDKLIEDIMKYADGVDPIGKTHIREGIVVRIENRPKFTAYKHKSMAFKIIEGIIKEDAIEPDIEERDSLS